jgi:hypothetical protein
MTKMLNVVAASIVVLGIGAGLAAGQGTSDYTVGGTVASIDERSLVLTNVLGSIAGADGRMAKVDKVTFSIDASTRIGSQRGEAVTLQPGDVVMVTYLIATRHARSIRLLRRSTPAPPASGDDSVEPGSPSGASSGAGAVATAELSKLAGTWDVLSKYGGGGVDPYLGGHFVDLDPLVVTVDGHTLTLSDVTKSRRSTYQVDGVSHPYRYETRGDPVVGTVKARTEDNRVVIEITFEHTGMVERATATRTLWVDGTGTLNVNTMATLVGGGQSRIESGKLLFKRQTSR